MCVSVCPCVCVLLDVWEGRMDGGWGGGCKGGTAWWRLRMRKKQDRRMRDG